VAGIQMPVRSKCHGKGHSDNSGNCMQTYTQRLHNTFNPYPANVEYRVSSY